MPLFRAMAFSPRMELLQNPWQQLAWSGSGLVRRVLNPSELNILLETLPAKQEYPSCQVAMG